MERGCILEVTKEVIGNPIRVDIRFLRRREYREFNKRETFSAAKFGMGLKIYSTYTPFI